MASAWSPVLQRPVLADLLPRTIVRDAVVVIAAALVTAASAQVEIPLGFSPVPISGQTFAVLLTGAALGPLRGVLGQGLYLLLAGVGFPFFSGGASGWEYIAGATGGYLVGFVFAAALVGACARRGMDRRAPSTIVAMVLGNLVIYAFGLSWLAVVTGQTFGVVLSLGLWPFLVGDALKMLLAAGLLPGAWRLANR